MSVKSEDIQDILHCVLPECASEGSEARFQISSTPRNEIIHVTLTQPISNASVWENFYTALKLHLGLGLRDQKYPPLCFVEIAPEGSKA